tara:strand:+ start:320 stop:547 length:228 start_codon:yes stop_codon:yes gene_type:complete
MGLFLRQDENKSDLQNRVASELQERLKERDIKAKETDPSFLDNNHQTRPAGMIIMVLFVILMAAIAAFAFNISQN